MTDIEIPADILRKGESLGQPSLAREVYEAGYRAARQWRSIDSAPKDGMFIWAAPKGEGKWSLGLAYRTVSGGWADAYGAPPERATHWTPLPPPPSSDEEQEAMMPVYRAVEK